MQSCCLYCPNIEGQDATTKVCFAHRTIGFFFFKKHFASHFSSSMWLLQFECEIFDFFQEILQASW
jgi:hypothetical protein